MGGCGIGRFDLRSPVFSSQWTDVRTSLCVPLPVRQRDVLLSLTADRLDTGNLNSSTSAVFAAVTDYQKYRLQERVIWLPEPIRFSPDDVIKVTCVYNTTGRTTKTSLGATLRDEMCFMYAWISPPVRNFNQCWHVDPNQIQGLNGQSKPGKRGCYAQCGLHGSPEFKLPRGSSSWSSQDVDARVMAALGDRWPGAPVCED